MNFDSVLIITYGRSGSTLLQGLLNSIDGCLIRGENNNFCYYLYKTWESIYKSTKRHSPLIQNPWYGSHLLNDQLFLSQSKNLIYALLLADQAHNPLIKCYGFKEIRYVESYVGNDFQEYLLFLKKVFPNVAFIFNTRKVDQVAKSEWWAEMEKKEVENIILKAENNFLEHMIHFPDNTFHITYEDLVDKTSNLHNLFSFLGVSYDDNKIDEVLNRPHSYKTIAFK